jgi:hypothetical protein
VLRHVTSSNLNFGSSRKSVGDFGGYAWLQAAPV